MQEHLYAIIIHELNVKITLHEEDIRFPASSVQGSKNVMHAITR